MSEAAQQIASLQRQLGDVTWDEPEKFRVFGYGETDVFLPLWGPWITYGNWQIEGEFLIVWDQASMRHAYKIPEQVFVLKTETVAEKNNGDTVEEVEGHNGSTSETGVVQETGAPNGAHDVLDLKPGQEISETYGGTDGAGSVDHRSA